MRATVPSPTSLSAPPASEIEYWRPGAQCQSSTYPGGAARKAMPLAGCIAVPSPWAPSTSRNGFIASGSSAMCDWPSVPLYTRHIFGMRVVLSVGRVHRVGQGRGQDVGLERGDLHGWGAYNGRRRHRPPGVSAATSPDVLSCRG